MRSAVMIEWKVETKIGVGEINSQLIAYRLRQVIARRLRRGISSKKFYAR